MKYHRKHAHVLTSLTFGSIFILQILFSFLCSACAGVGGALEASPPPPHRAHQETEHTQKIVDRVVVKDSVIIETRHDTIFQTRTKVVNKVVFVTDTMFVHKTDTIFIREKSQEPKESKVASFLAELSTFAKLAISIIAFIIVFKIRKLLT